MRLPAVTVVGGGSMLKRVLSILMVFALCLAYVPVQVSAEDRTVSSTSDFWAFAAGDTMILGDDIESLNYEMDLSTVTGGTFKITLNGHSLVLKSITGLDGGTLEIDGPGTVNVTSFIATSGGLILLSDAEFEASNDLICDTGLDFFISITGSSLSAERGVG